MDDEEDESTLSNVFKSLLRDASSLADHSVHSSAVKRRHSRTCKALEKNQTAKGMKNSPFQSSATGDIVWARASPSNWWPGQVKSFKGPLISISFFGCNKTRWFNPSKILRFEETYPRMVKMVGVKLSYEIGLALDELARNIAIGLKCCCRVSAADEDGSWAVKRGFNPHEIFRFLRDKAVSPLVIEEEIATVVRVSAALHAFRYVSVVCNTSEVDEGFCSEGVLDCVRDMAVNQCVDKAVAQLSAFRRFASVKPSWVYQLDWEFEEDSLESHKIKVDLELPDCTSEDELYHGRTSDPEVDDSIILQEKCELLGVNHKREGREMCVLNMIDFSIFDKDENYESQIQVDADGAQSGDKGICRNTNQERTFHSCTEGASGMPEVDEDENYESQIQVDADGAQSGDSGICRNTSQERTLHSCTVGASGMPEVDTNETTADAICASLNSKLVISTLQNDPNHIIQVGEEVNLIRSIVPNLENGTGEGNPSIPSHSDKCNPVEVLSSAENLSLRRVPLYGGQLHSLPNNKCSVVSPIRVLNNPSNAAQCTALIPPMAPFAETALHVSANKRKLSEPPTFENYKSAQTSPPSGTLKSESNFTHVDNAIDRALFEARGGNDAIKRKLSEPPTFENYKSAQTSPPSATLTSESNFAHVDNAINRVLFEARGGNDAIKLRIRNQNCFSYYSGHVSKSYYRNRRQNHHLQSNFKAFYTSPLTRDRLHSTNNRSNSNSLDDNNRVDSSVLLNMKFPKDYALPSKEQLEKKFRVFGPLDHTRTKVFFYTGVGQVVFLHQDDAVAAYNYVTRKTIFDQTNVRFWFYKYDNCRNGSSSRSGSLHSSLNLKTCLKKSCTPELIDDRKNSRVRFTL